MNDTEERMAYLRIKERRKNSVSSFQKERISGEDCI